MQYMKKTGTERRNHPKFMKTAGIIAEYNPFHKGHAYQIQYAKGKLGADYVVVAMSGDYVQRGTPALVSKYPRAEMALRCGADLVLEMPVSVSTSSAETFAMGGISLLDGLGVVDMLCFGSECGQISALKELASILIKEPEQYKKLLKTLLSQGLSFPAARSQALTEYFKNPRNFSGDDFDGVLTPLLNEVTEILRTPNNILGIEYCKALLRLNSTIRPVTIRRKGMGYHDSALISPAQTSAGSCGETEFASASAIRKSLLHSTGSLSFPEGTSSVSDSERFGKIAGQIPPEAFPVLEKVLLKQRILTEDAFDSILGYRILKENVQELTSYLDMSESLAQRIVNQRNIFEGFSQFAALLKTRDITQTRIQRALLHLILDIHQVPSVVSYARVLGFRKESGALLKSIKEHSSIPVITRLADAKKSLHPQAFSLLSETTFASNLYESLLSQKSRTPFIHEYQQKIVIV